MGFDLKKNNFSEKAEAGFEFELLIPEIKEKTGAFVTVRGKESPKVKAFYRKFGAEMQHKEQMAKKRNRDVDPMTFDEIEDFAIESALVRIISWRGFEEDGKKLEFTQENAKRILKEHPWIREQVTEESELLANFI